MHWSGLGSGLDVLEVRLREVDFLVRRLLRLPRRDPEQELPDAELSEREQRAALSREAVRRTLEHG